MLYKLEVFVVAVVAVMVIQGVCLANAFSAFTTSYSPSFASGYSGSSGGGSGYSSGSAGGVSGFTSVGSGIGGARAAGGETSKGTVATNHVSSFQAMNPQQLANFANLGWVLNMQGFSCSAGFMSNTQGAGSVANQNAGINPMKVNWGGSASDGSSFWSVNDMLGIQADQMNMDGFTCSIDPWTRTESTEGWARDNSPGAYTVPVGYVPQPRQKPPYD